MQPSIDIPSLVLLRDRFPPPQILDVRRSAAIAAHPVVIAGAQVADLHDVIGLAARLERWRPVAVYCAEGHERSQDAAAALRAVGIDAQFLAGGLAGWEAAGGETVPRASPTQWVTRERPKIDRIACPWLIRRFIDPTARIHYVPAADVAAFAHEHGTTPFDIPGAEYGHHGEHCSFDAFIARHHLADPALAALARIVRGADTGRLGDAPEAPGLLALSLGLSRLYRDDHAMLQSGMAMYDALYLWCRDACGAAPLRAAA